jgi:hypothetical protein
MLRLAAVVFASALMMLGCQKGPASDERLISKLQAEKDRLAGGGTAAQPALPAPEGQPDPLAARAAMPDQPKALKLPQQLTFQVGKAVYRLASVETSHSASNGKTTLTTNDCFVKVTLLAQVVGGGPVDLGAAKLVAGGKEFQIAKDAQRLAGSRDLAPVLREDDLTQAVLFFEAPLSAIGPGLRLLVTGADGISLQ